MNYGLYLSAGGALTNMQRQDVLANNLANVNTVGFKADDIFAYQRLPERLESGAMSIEPQEMLEQLGGGLELRRSMINLSQGPIQQTGNDLDLAIRGDGFFVVESGNGDKQPRLTRDGRFSLNSSSELVMTGTGLRVLDDKDRPIRLNEGSPARINDDGGIIQNGTTVAKIRLTSPSNPTQLHKVGDNLFRVSPAASATLGAATGTIAQRHVEGSSVDPIMALNAMINVSKAVAANTKMMQFHDHLMDQAVNTFGRVA